MEIMFVYGFIRGQRPISVVLKPFIKERVIPCILSDIRYSMLIYCSTYRAKIRSSPLRSNASCYSFLKGL